MNKKKKMKTVIKVLKRLYNIEHYLARDKFMLLIGTILSQRTRDENTTKAEENLFSKTKNPKELSKETNLYLSHVSKTLKELSDMNIIRCLNPDSKKGRLYGITSKGREVIQSL